MKAISLWQPYASLMAAGYKRIETRDWEPHGLRAGQLVAIHAAKHWTAEERALCADDPFFRRYLTLAERRGLWSSGAHPPLGGVVAIARFQGAYPTEQLVRAHVLSEHEHAFGAYQPFRYGWVFSAVRPLAIIPATGMQGLFDWTPPRNAELAALYVEASNALRSEDPLAALLPATGVAPADVGVTSAQQPQQPQQPTRVVHCRREPFQIYVGRQMPRYPELKATGWGNPYTARNLPPGCANAVEAYRQWVLRQPRLLARLSELRGRALGCWCAPEGGLPGNLDGHTCHGEVLAALADGWCGQCHRVESAQHVREHETAADIAVKQVVGRLTGTGLFQEAHSGDA